MSEDFIIHFKVSIDKEHRFFVNYVDKEGANKIINSPFIDDIFQTIKREYRNYLEPCDREYPPLCVYYKGKIKACNYGEFHHKNCPYTYGSGDLKSRVERDG